MGIYRAVDGPVYIWRDETPEEAVEWILERMLTIEGHDYYQAVEERKHELFPDGERPDWIGLAQRFGMADAIDHQATFDALDRDLSGPYSWDPAWSKVLRRWMAKHPRRPWS